MEGTEIMPQRETIRGLTLTDLRILLKVYKSHAIRLTALWGPHECNYCHQQAPQSEDIQHTPDCLYVKAKQIADIIKGKSKATPPVARAGDSASA